MLASLPVALFHERAHSDWIGHGLSNSQNPQGLQTLHRLQRQEEDHPLSWTCTDTHILGGFWPVGSITLPECCSMYYILYDCLKRLDPCASNSLWHYSRPALMSCRSVMAVAFKFQSIRHLKRGSGLSFDKSDYLACKRPNNNCFSLFLCRLRVLWREAHPFYELVTRNVILSCKERRNGARHSDLMGFNITIIAGLGGHHEKKWRQKICWSS